MTYLYNSTGYPVYHKKIVKGDGCYVYDDAGNAYLDFEAGVWCLALGHNPPGIAAAIQEQAAQISHVGYKYNHSVTETAAEKLVKISGIPGGKCVFLSSGSEAVEYGIQVAKTLRPGKRCVSLSGQYLSAYGGGAQVQKTAGDCLPWEDSQEKSTEDWCRELSAHTDFREVGLLLFEAGNSSGLVKLPPASLVRALKILTAEYNILILADEVTCGIGRCGKWFGYMNYHMIPHMAAVGKGLGNGYPVSAVVLSDKTASEALESGFHYAQSHQNDPLGCRIALEVIRNIEDNRLLEQAVVLGNYLREQYGRIKERFPAIEEVKGIGLLNSIRFSGRIQPKMLEALDKQLFETGYIVGMKPFERTLRTYLPFIADKTMIDSYISALEKCMTDLFIYR